MVINISGLTDIGQDRDENQDSIDWYVLPEQHYAYLLVADGMGGYTGGAVASRLAVEVIGDALKVLPYDPSFAAGPDPELLKYALQQALQQANQRILAEKQLQPQLAHMGTTLVAAVIWRQLAVVAHVGDSRAYLWQDRQLTRLTRDHSIVQELLDSNAITPEEAERSQQRNVLTRALGVGAEVAADFNVLQPASGALLLACSDGLTGFVSDTALAQELGQHLPILESCYRLVHMANSAGGRDNISLVIAEVGSVDI